MVLIEKNELRLFEIFFKFTETREEKSLNSFNRDFCAKKPLKVACVSS